MVGEGVWVTPFPYPTHNTKNQGGEALEAANSISAIIFDKTGTLTKGVPVLTDYVVGVLKPTVHMDGWKILSL